LYFDKLQGFVQIIFLTPAFRPKFIMTALTLKSYNLLAQCIPAFLICFCSCKSAPSLFRKISSGETGIQFANTITENDSINPIDMEFLYNGGGVGVGDFNNDGLPDLYFTASTSSNKLYLNKGNLSFTDVTDESKVNGDGEWFNAVSVVDINNDGLQDIYLSASIKKNPAQRRNLLYINQGPGEDKVPVFKAITKPTAFMKILINSTGTIGIAH